LLYIFGCKLIPGGLKLSLISNLFSGESKPVAVAAVQPVVERPVSKPTPVSIEKTPVRPMGVVVRRPAVITKTQTAAIQASVKPRVDQSEQLRNTINLWAASWTAQDVEAYLSFYADSFRPAIGTAAKWRAQRRIRLKKPKYIRIDLDDIKLTNIAENNATIEFVQRYESNIYKDRTRKRLDLVLRNGQWKIRREVSI